MEEQYANIVAFRVTHNELVLEFGNFFAGQDNDRKKPDHTDFKVRVILPADMIDILFQSLGNAKDARDQMRKAIAGQATFALTPAESEQKRA